MTTTPVRLLRTTWSTCTVGTVGIKLVLLHGGLEPEQEVQEIVRQTLVSGSRDPLTDEAQPVVVVFCRASPHCSKRIANTVLVPTHIAVKLRREV